MKLPRVTYADRITKGTQIRFGGLEHTLSAGDGEIWDMENLTGDFSPVLSPRQGRWKLGKLEKPGGLFAMKKLCWVDGETFYYGGVPKGAVSEGTKQFAVLNGHVVILPDKCFYNPESDTFGSLESRWSGEKLTFSDGLLYGEKAVANCVQYEGVNWADYFREGDAVTITGCTKHPENNKTPIIRQIDGDKLYFYEYIFTLEKDAAYTETGEMEIARTVPDMKVLCANENRLWGCDDTTIYASKQGDVFSWNVYDGLESDAWFLAPGEGGSFTGAVAYKGFSVFFKEEQIYKVYGSTPSTFKAVSSASLGLAEDSGGSLAIAGETLFYLNRSGIMAYAGGIPQPVGGSLGPERFRNAVGGSDGIKYYASMQGEDGTWWLYVYDTRSGMWHKEDRQRITHFARMDGLLYFLNEEGEIWCTGKPEEMPEGAEPEGEIHWMAEFADFTEESPDKKGVGKLQIRLELEEDASIEVWMQFDSDGVWRRVQSVIGEGPKRSYYLPIIPRRCDHYRLRLKGTGGAKIYSLAREYFPSTAHKSRPGRN